MSPHSDIAYLGLGSNLGPRARNLSLAAMRLALLDGLDLLRVSPVYETAPWGLADQPRFLNLVLAVRVALPPRELLAHAKRLEADMGRLPGERWGPRVIDIDILLIGAQRMSTHDLTIPHPRIAQRQFVLAPLADIAPTVEVAPGLSASDLAQPRSDDLHRIGSVCEALRQETRGE